MKKILWMFLFALAAFAGHEAAKLQYQVTETLNLLDRSSGIDLSDVEAGVDLVSDDKIINILLVGADKREYWSEAGRSDSVMIATMDTRHKKLKLTSLMRDMYVTIPGHGETRFNAAYSYGGIELLYQTIAANFGIQMDGYVIVDFAAFKKVINSIGGVDVELTQAEYEYLMQKYAGKESITKGLVPGENRMNGSQALAYSRIRQDNQGDFGRTQRQRNIMSSVFKKAKSQSFGELKDLAAAVIPNNVVTDLTNQEIISYMMTVVTMGVTEFEQLRIPIDGAYTQQRINNQAVLVLDWDQNKRALNQFIFGE